MIAAMSSGESWFWLPTCTNRSDASMNSTLSSFFDFLSTMMQVAMEVPKNRFGGSWITASMKLPSSRYLRIFCSLPPR